MANDLQAMRNRISDELNRPDLVAGGQIDKAIVSAVTHYATRKWWFNTALIDDGDPTVAGDAFIDYPAGLLTLEKDGLYADTGSGFCAVTKTSAKYIADMNQGGGTSNGPPWVYADLGGQVQVYPAPGGVYQLQWLGVVLLGELVDDTDTNDWLVEAEELIRQRAKQNLRIDIMQSPAAMQEATALAMRGGADGTISIMEMSALRVLKQRNAKRLSSGQLRARG